MVQLPKWWIRYELSHFSLHGVGRSLFTARLALARCRRAWRPKRKWCEETRGGKSAKDFPAFPVDVPFDQFWDQYIYIYMGYQRISNSRRFTIGTAMYSFKWALCFYPTHRRSCLVIQSQCRSHFGLPEWWWQGIQDDYRTDMEPKDAQSWTSTNISAYVVSYMYIIVSSPQRQKRIERSFWIVRFTCGLPQWDPSIWKTPMINDYLPQCPLQGVENRGPAPKMYISEILCIYIYINVSEIPWFHVTSDSKMRKAREWRTQKMAAKCWDESPQPYGATRIISRRRVPFNLWIAYNADEL